MWKATPKPSISFSNRGRIASTVTSRPVSPVPPVEMMTSTSSRPSHWRTCARIERMSSLTIRRSPKLCPASAMRPASTLPDLSVSRLRVSDTVSTATRTGMKERLLETSGIVLELLLEREEIAPGEALLRRLAQQIGGVQRRQERNASLAASEIEPAPSELQYAFRSADQALRRRGAEADEKARLLDLDGAPQERQAHERFLVRRRAIARRPPEDDIGDIGRVLRSPSVA